MDQTDTAERGTRAHARKKRTHAYEVEPEKGPWRPILRGLSAGLLLLVIGVGVASVVIPKATGAVPLAVLTSSMEPTLPPGTLIVVRPVDTSTLVAGDVATYQMTSGRPEVITHRIIAVNAQSNGETTFTFQGDNNAEPDSEQVLSEQIQGQLWYSMPLLGHASVAMNKIDRATIIPILGVLLMGYSAVSTITGIVKAKKVRRQKRDRLTTDDTRPRRR